MDGDSRLLTRWSGEARLGKRGVSPLKWLDLCLAARVGNTDYYYYFPFMTAMCLTGDRIHCGELPSPLPALGDHLGQNDPINN